MQELSTKITRASKGQGTYGLFYASQVQQIKDEIGDLESIRKNLGMSRKQICQLLLVNPSAWTRWTKSSQGAPPHFYRALEWLIYIHNKQNPNNEKETTKISSLPIYHKTKQEMTYSSIPMDFIEEKEITQLNTEKDHHQIKSLKRQILLLKWLVIFLWVCMLFLLFQMFIRDL